MREGWSWLPVGAIWAAILYRARRGWSSSCPRILLGSLPCVAILAQYCGQLWHSIVANCGTVLWPIVAIALQLSFHPAGDSGYLCNQSWAGPGVCDATCGRCTYCPVFEDPYCQVNIQVIFPRHASRPVLVLVSADFFSPVRLSHDCQPATLRHACKVVAPSEHRTRLIRNRGSFVQ